MPYTPSTNRTDPTQGAYNGFSLADRFTAGRFGGTFPAVRPVKVPKGVPCAVCGMTGGQIGWHQEDYRTPVDAFAVCAWCHWALHCRIKPRQADGWTRWIVMLSEGWRPPVCPWGTRWATWAAKYLRKPVGDWDWTNGHPCEVSPLARLLDHHHRAVPYVPESFRLIEGAAHLPGQWDSRAATGGLIVMEFDPPLPWT